jgi:hypothetical protein
VIKDTCKCGAVFSYESRASLASTTHVQEMAAHAQWLAAHEACRRTQVVAGFADVARRRGG